MAHEDHRFDTERDGVRWNRKELASLQPASSVPVEKLSAEAWLRTKGLRVTPQRRLVLDRMLQQVGRHWSADELHEALRAQLSELARGTIYNILAELTRVGLVEELRRHDGSALYGVRLVPHHHFYCEDCRRWFDVKPVGLGSLALSADDRGRFAVQTVAVVFHGLCVDCARNDTPIGPS